MLPFRLIADMQGAAEFAPFGNATALVDSPLFMYQFSSPAISAHLRQLIFQQNSIGLTCLALPERSWQAIFFDMDSTVIAEESIVELARAAGKEAEVEALTTAAMAGQIDFEASLRQRVALLKGLPIERLEEVRERLQINRGMHAFMSAAKKLSIKLFLVSGGFNCLAESIADELGFNGFLANQLEIKEQKLTGQMDGPIIDGVAKANFLRKICQYHNIKLSDAVAIGDGANDIPMMQAAGAAIGYHPKPILFPHINGANFHDHRLLIPALL